MNFTRASCPFFHDCSIAENSLCHLIALKRTLPSLIIKKVHPDDMTLKKLRHLGTCTGSQWIGIIG